MKKEELLKNIKIDLESGVSWAKIMEKYNLKSDYLIRQVKGDSIIRHEDYNYITIHLNIDTLKKLDDDKFTTIYAYFKNANRIIVYGVFIVYALFTIRSFLSLPSSEIWSSFQEYETIFSVNWQ